MDVYLKELTSKLIELLRGNNFASNPVDCSTSINGTEPPPTSKSTMITQFEGQLNEMISLSSMLQMYPNSTNRIEFYLKYSVFGRDGNELPLLMDESPVLTELAMIDNAEFNLTPNISLKAPRRFFRIGIAPVRFFEFLFFCQKIN